MRSFSRKSEDKTVKNTFLNPIDLSGFIYCPNPFQVKHIAARLKFAIGKNNNGIIFFVVI